MTPQGHVPALRPYLPAIDGLRGIALLLLVANVAPELVGDPDSEVLLWIWARFKGGWLGIDLTFAIGGFLTTRMLRSVEPGELALREFRVRRALRVLPATLTYCALVTAMAVFTYRFKVLTTDPAVLISTWTFTSNLWIALRGWSVPATSVLWSICVAEQWHLFYPRLALGLSRRRLVQVLLVLMCLAPLARFLVTETLGKTAVFVLLPTRMDAIAAGCLVALWVEQDASILLSWSKRLLLPSLLFYLVTIFTPYREDSSPMWYVLFGYSAVAIGSGVFCAWVITAPTSQTAWLERVSLVSLGRMCLGFHLGQVISSQIVDLAERRLLHFGVAGATVVWFACTWLLAWLSYRYLEMPFLSRRARFRTARVSHR